MSYSNVQKVFGQGYTLHTDICQVRKECDVFTVILNYVHLNQGNILQILNIVPIDRRSMSANETINSS